MQACSPERTRLVELMRSFYSGRITNDQLEDAALSSATTDHAVAEVFSHGVWCTYSDLREYKLKDSDKLNFEERRAVARWMLFLKSGQTYKWPNSRKLSPWLFISTFFAGVLLALWTWNWSFGFLVFGPLIVLTIVHDRLEQRRIFRNGDIQFWPFICQKDFEEALRYPPYLAGKSTSR